jgi:tRNA (mo5U34)-methyltransferase
MSMTQERRHEAAHDKQRQIDALAPWFHNLHLPGGVQTLPHHFLGGDFPNFKWQEIAPWLPSDLSGWRVLDVGCNAGFYSFQLAQRGASVLGIDVEPHYLAQAEWARGELGLDADIEFRCMEVYDIARSRETFDLVWFMGVFYHLRYPLLGLEAVADVAQRLLVVQTLTDGGGDVAEPPEDLPFGERRRLRERGWPTMSFVEHRLAGDPTNWWVPNDACVEAMIRSAGLEIAAKPGHDLWICRPVPGRETSGDLRALRRPV